MRSWCALGSISRSSSFDAAVDDDPADFAPQALARARGLEADLLLRRGHQTLTLLGGADARLLLDVVRAVLRLVDDLPGALARLAQDLLGALARLLQLLLAAIGGGQSVRDLLLPLLHRAA